MLLHATHPRAAEFFNHRLDDAEALVYVLNILEEGLADPVLEARITELLTESARGGPPVEPQRGSEGGQPRQRERGDEPEDRPGAGGRGPTASPDAERFAAALRAASWAMTYLHVLGMPPPFEEAAEAEAADGEEENLTGVPEAEDATHTPRMNPGDVWWI